MDRQDSPKDDTPADTENEALDPGWGLFRKILFRFGLIYALLYCLPDPLTIHR